MSFLMYDIGFLILFAIFVGVLLYRGRKKVKKEGLLLLYKTEWGIKLINRFGDRNRKILNYLGYFSIGLGYILMAGIIYFVYFIVRVYISRPDVVSAMKIPPIMPLIPYIDKLVPGIPPFYFTYFIIILALIAIPHEFFHGIYARVHKIKIKKTGFGFFPFFLPIFLAAFVELDEKRMEKKSKFAQMSILSAGTFANILTAIVFFFIMWFVFVSAFVPAGVMFNTYSYSIIPTSSITSINGSLLDNPDAETIMETIEETGNANIVAGDLEYYGIKQIDKEQELVAVYDNSPALLAELTGAIYEINDAKINNLESLSEELDKYSPGDAVVIKTKTSEGTKEYKITLGKYPTNDSEPWLGIGFLEQTRGMSGALSNLMSSFKDLHIYYEAKCKFAEFIYYLLWWTVLICISVALVNMLPVGIFDGGRFFYLTILGITRSEKIARKSFKFLTWFFLLIVLVLMFFWAKSFF